MSVPVQVLACAPVPVVSRTAASWVDDESSPFTIAERIVATGAGASPLSGDAAAHPARSSPMAAMA